jgi:hypothetical protein
MARWFSLLRRAMTGGDAIDGLGRGRSLSTVSDFKGQIKPVGFSESEPVKRTRKIERKIISNYSGLENRCNVWQFWTGCDLALDGV